MQQASAPRLDHTVPVALASQLVRLLKRWQISPDDFLSGVGLPAAILEQPHERLPIATMCALLERARDLTGEPGLGYHLGLQTRATLYGYLGFAALSASSVGDALGLVVQFAPIFSTALTINMHVEGNLGWLRLDEHAELGSVRDIVLISVVLGLREMGRAATGEPLAGSTELAIPEPEYHPRFAHLAPGIRFGQPMNRILFDSAIIDLPLLMADPLALQLAQRQCERDLDELGFDAQLVARVRRLIGDDLGTLRSFEEVATRLRISPRTLRRRLAERGVSFAAVVDSERRDRALHLLRWSRLSIEDVAQRLDYRTTSGFAKAFYRWTGKAPGAYKRAMRLSQSSQDK
jgi:AraC-like DNA-binding protein